MNTLENKRKFFALYYGIKCLPVKVYGSANDVHWSTFRHEEFKESYLELKSLSTVLDEDAYGVGIKVNCWSWTERKMEFFKDDDMRDVHIVSGKNFAEVIGKEFGSGHSHPFANNSTDILHAYDFLRSKGYALPWNGITVEQQIDFGWIKLKE